AIAGALIVAATFIPPRRVAAQSEFTSPRNADVDARGARAIRIDAAAGLLRVQGRPGINEVRVRGTAVASRRDWLEDIKLVAERRGNEVFIKAEIRENNRSGWRDWEDNRRGLDLIIEVPSNMALEVEDGSGEATFTSVGPLNLNDGSGSIDIRGAKGRVSIIDGSGEITLNGIEGDVTIEDGSGGIDARDITGNFTISQDGSGSIAVDRVAGDFIVAHDGSGSIRYDTVKGRVSIPERQRRRRSDH
ncbi:MAG TPA: hypothetical protein VM939_06870, partial [Gemmatimonadaceae bacterium]|nr:hypothetical protein [Gemmatimonadaceae bacterium]